MKKELEKTVPVVEIGGFVGFYDSNSKWVSESL